MDNIETKHECTPSIQNMQILKNSMIADEDAFLYKMKILAKYSTSVPQNKSGLKEPLKKDFYLWLPIVGIDFKPSSLEAFN